MDGQFSCNKSDYIWHNISLDSSLIDKEFDNTVGVDDEGQFKPKKVAEKLVVMTVLEYEYNNNDDNKDDNDDNNSNKNDE